MNRNPWAVMLCFLFFCYASHAQENGFPVTSGQSMEKAVGRDWSDRQNADDDSDPNVILDKLPVNVNTADVDMLVSLGASALQAEALLTYRNLFGPLIELQELQAIPGWDIATIRHLIPYITLATPFNVKETFRQLLTKSQQRFTASLSRVLETTSGYQKDSTGASNSYLGTPYRMFFRYKCYVKDRIGFACTGEKDAGEQFFKGYQKTGFDFYSAHLSIGTSGILKRLIVGDYTVNMGQGLIQWQRFSLGKSTDVLDIKKQSDIFTPYQSLGEQLFHRGGAFSLRLKNWELSSFLSFRKLDANRVMDSIPLRLSSITSYNESGFHRTVAECADRFIQKQFTGGISIQYRFATGRLGVNSVFFKRKYPLVKDAYWYDLYRSVGRYSQNLSLDYSVTHQNLHAFGEWAFDENSNMAFLQGILVSVARNTDVSILYRNISPAYRSQGAQAFTENSRPVNEKGLFIGMSIRSSNKWQLDFFADHFIRPWLQFGIDKPSYGRDYGLKTLYRHSKKTEISAIIKAEKKMAMDNSASAITKPVLFQDRILFRYQLTSTLSDFVNTRLRLDYINVSQKEKPPAFGVLMFGDLSVKVPACRMSVNSRFYYFNTADYDSRLYAMEHEGIAGFSSSLFYGFGYRYAFGMNVKPTKHIALTCNVSRSVYPNELSLGSGLDEIFGQHKTSFTLGFQYIQ